MNTMKPKLHYFAAFVALNVFAAAVPAFGNAPQGPPNNTPDNTKSNKDVSPTADQQKNNSADVETAKKIRASIMADKSLSTYAHNVKVIVQDGKVTLKGPVRSEEEKAGIASKAESVAGAGNVDNQLEVAPSH